MGVHDIAEYVKYHQAKLRDQQAQSNPTPTPAPKRPRGGVNEIHSKASFEQQLQTDKLVVVDFFAIWCGPCKVIAPKIVEMSNSEDYGDKAVFLKVDVDSVPEVAQKYGIRAMPTFMVFKNGEKVGEVVGANERAIRAAIDNSL